MPGEQRKRLVWMLGFLGVLTLAMGKPLAALAAYASRTDLHSHIVLIPLVSAYLLHLRWGVLPSNYRSSPGWALVPMAVGLAALGVVWGWIPGVGTLSLNDRLACYAAAYAALNAGYSDQSVRYARTDTTSASPPPHNSVTFSRLARTWSVWAAMS